MEAQEKLQKLKEFFGKERDRLLKILLIDDPMAIAQPQAAQQVAMGIRGSNQILKMLDDDYDFSIKQIPGYVG
jgi:hypothetical protein